MSLAVSVHAGFRKRCCPGSEGVEGAAGTREQVASKGLQKGSNLLPGAHWDLVRGTKVIVSAGVASVHVVTAEEASEPEPEQERCDVVVEFRRELMVEVAMVSVLGY